MSKKENGQDDGQQLPKDDVKEDEWHYKLREEFISYYTQYIQSQGFALVQLSTPLPFKMAKG